MLTDCSCIDFINMLASGSPTPGGGGASAIVGALGVALGSMVGNLTLGKKKYESVQQDIKIIIDRANNLQNELLLLVQADAEAFEPLAKAYGMPCVTNKEKSKRNTVLEESLKYACRVPLNIMEKSLDAINLHEELETKGTKLAISDVGVGVLLCKSALMGASLNVYINTKMMQDREYADNLKLQVSKMLQEGIPKADKIYTSVMSKLI